MLTERELNQVKSRAAKSIEETLDNFNTLSTPQQIAVYPLIAKYNLLYADISSGERLVKCIVQKTKEIMGRIDILNGPNQGDLILGRVLQDAIELEQIIIERNKKFNSNKRPHDLDSTMEIENATIDIENKRQRTTSTDFV